jgi:hypothetical protein
VEQPLGDTLVAAIGNGAARVVQGNSPFLTLLPYGLAWFFGQTDPRRFEVGSCHILDDTGVERCDYQLLVALQLASNHFGCYMRFAYGLARFDQRPVVSPMAKRWGYFGAHRSVDVDQASLSPSSTSLIGGNPFLTLSARLTTWKFNF